ncbi:putative ribonuclease H-like domain-containing protein, partial [Tanacetum coccineum]
KPIEFEVGDRFMLKVSPWKGVIRFGKRGKLNPRYVRPFRVLAKGGKVAYRLELPQELSRVYHTFHVSNLKKCYADEPLVMPLEGIHVDDKLYQMSANDKNGLGYGTLLDEINNKSKTNSEISMSVFEVRSSDEEITPANDRFSKADGYHVIPPPITRNFLNQRAYISFAGLDEYAIRKKIIESKTTKLNIDTSISKTSETVDKTNEVNIEKPKLVYESVMCKPKINRDKVIIEDWNLDDEDDVSVVKTVSPVMTNQTQISTDHLIKDCDFYDKKSPKPKLNTMVNTGQRVVKPVWDNAKRVNQQKISNNLKYPQARRTFVPSGVLTKTGLVNPIRPNRKKAVHIVSTTRPISTARPVSTAREFAPKIAQTSSAIRPIYPRMDNVRPRGNPESILQEHSVVDSGCSSHITGNKAYLLDYKDYNGGFVDFGSDPKGGKITGKGKIRTANLDFDDVYFVDELKFNLFSVLQMCDKKNSVLFTNTKCLILSPNFKLLDESQVVLRAPRQNGMYSLDLKNIVPSGGIQESYVASSSGNNKETHQEYILLPLHPHGLRISVKDVVLDAKEKPSEKAPKDNDLVTQEMIAKAMDDATRYAFEEEKKNISSTKRAAQATSINKLNTGSQSVNTANTPYVSAASTPTSANTGESSFFYLGGQIPIDASTLPNADLPTDPNMPDLKDDSDVFSNEGKKACSYMGLDVREGIDYDEVFAPVARIEAIRLFLAFASYMGFLVYQMDVKSAFLYGNIEEEVYVHQPPGFVDPAHPHKVYKVVKALYGLHQAPRAWYETLSTFLLENGFKRGTIDKTLFIKKNKNDIMLVQVYVDDIIFGSIKQSMCNEFEDCMHKRFQMSSMGELTFFLRLQVKQQPDRIFISQDKYVADIIKKFDFWSIRTATTPIESNKPLVKDEDGIDVDVHVYRYNIGYLMYLTASRPDIMFAISSFTEIVDFLKGTSLRGYAGEHVPLLPAMLAGAAEDQGEGLANPAEPNPTPIDPSPTFINVVDEATTTGVGVGSEGATNTTFCLDAGLDSDNIHESPHRIDKFGERAANHSKNNLWKAVLTLVERVKSLEVALKRKTKKVVVSEDEETKNQGRKIQDIDDDPLVSLRKTRTTDKDISTGLDAEVEVSPGRVIISSGSAGVNTGSTPVSTPSIVQKVNVIISSLVKGQREGKAPMSTEDDEEAARQVHLDALLAKRILEEQELSEQQEKRKDEVQEAAQHYSEEDWDNIRAKLEANAELVKDVLGESMTSYDFAKRMLDMINQRKKYFAEQKAKARRNKPMTQAEQRTYMATYLKNKGTWKPTQLKKLTFVELKEEFEKLVRSIESFVPKDYEIEKIRVKRACIELQKESSKKQKTIGIKEESVAEPIVAKEEEIEEQIKKRGKRKKQKARKGIHADKTAQHEVKEDMEALIKGNDTDSSSGTDIPISAILVAIKPPSIANWKIIKLELYRLVMQRYGTNGPEDEYERVFWGDIKTIVHCLNLESADIYILIERRYPLPADVFETMIWVLEAAMELGKDWFSVGLATHTTISHQFPPCLTDIKNCLVTKQRLWSSLKRSVWIQSSKAQVEENSRNLKLTSEVQV